MTIVLQTNNSEKNKVGKSLSTITTLTGYLKAKTSIIDPVIMVECDLDDLTDCNYMTISTFGRKYFVTNISSVRAGLVEISGHVDVLDSFATQIKSCSAIIRKQETNYNLYLNDGSFRVYQNPEVITKEFPSGFSSPEYVLAVAGS